MLPSMDQEGGSMVMVRKLAVYISGMDKILNAFQNRDATQVMLRLGIFRHVYLGPVLENHLCLLLLPSRFVIFC